MEEASNTGMKAVLFQIVIIRPHNHYAHLRGVVQFLCVNGMLSVAIFCDAEHPRPLVLVVVFKGEVVQPDVEASGEIEMADMFVAAQQGDL